VGCVFLVLGFGGRWGGGEREEEEEEVSSWLCRRRLLCNACTMCVRRCSRPPVCRRKHRSRTCVPSLVISSPSKFGGLVIRWRSLWCGVNAGVVKFMLKEAQ
jgi:hypothetical protein